MEIIPPKKVKVVAIEGKNRGVVATEDIAKDEVIEICPTVILSKDDTQVIKNQSGILKYYYLEEPEFDRSCLMLGFGSLYNHSFEPNADVDYEEDATKQYVVYRALRDIKKDEEITWNYNFDDDVVDYLSE